MGNTDSKNKSEGAAHPGPQSQPKLHNTGRLSPVPASRRNFHQVHSNNPHRGTDKARNPKTKKGFDWTSLHETNRWRSDSQSDSNGDIEDRHLFTGSESSALLGRSTSPGPPPYRNAKNVRDYVQKRHEGSANSKSGSITTGTNHRSPSGPALPDLRLQVRKAKQVAGSSSSTTTQGTDTRPKPLPRSKSSGGTSVRKSTSTES